jgi:two-component system cell cycle response regulator DivK
VGQKILVVEDNELNLKLFCDLLRAHGYEAEPVRDGRDAVERARAFAPDLVVMDIQMPHVSGLELIEQMKADDGLKSTPIMAVTAYAARGDEERIRDAGAEGYVSKPISVLRFVEAVAGLLDAAVERGAAPAVEVVEIASEGDAEPIPTAIDTQAGGDAVDAVAAEAEVETAEESVGEAHPGASESLLHSREDGNPGEKPLDGEEGEEPGSVPA